MTTQSPAVKAAIKVMADHIRALNTHDEEALQATLHFPHVRLSAAELKIWPTAESYFADFKSRAGAHGIIPRLRILHYWQKAKRRFILMLKSSAIMLKMR